MILEELNLSISHLKGIGVEGYKAFADLGITLVRDLLQHFPLRYEDRQTFYTLDNIQSASAAAYIVEVVGHSYVATSRERLLKILVSDGSAQAELVCFGRSFLVEQLTVGKRIYLFASFTYRYGTWQSSAFDFEPYAAQQTQRFLRLYPIYPATAKLTQGRIRKSIKLAFELIPTTIESLVPKALWQQQGFSEAKQIYLQGMHEPANQAQLLEARRALAFEELFLFHLKREFHSLQAKTPVREVREFSNAKVQEVMASLPFSLTQDQLGVLGQIRDDLGQTYTMRRLLQADVGAGKTLVALLSALYAIEHGQQVALLAPTELLARQHAQNAYRLLQPFGVEVAFLSGNIRLSGRLELLSRLASGEVDLVVGTHALFSDDVHYQNLGYVIVDEQHRFGVQQRNKLQHKAAVVDLLLMSATPIPQTLQMSYLGNIEISSIYELPQGRLPIKTHLVRQGNEQKVYEQVKQLIEAGRQAYFVYPLIDQQEDERQALLQVYEQLMRGEFKDYRLAIIHSRLDEESKRATMELFTRGLVDILFSTSVIEVGVDVPNANVMVIANAERFGLAALHQLRGRIGRGVHEGRCFLVYYEGLSDVAKERLRILYEQQDGFVIAEQDLELRGPGDLGGIKQSGFMRFNLSSTAEDADLWQAAEEAARAILPNLSQKTLEYDRLRDYIAQAPWHI